MVATFSVDFELIIEAPSILSPFTGSLWTPTTLPERKELDWTELFCFNHQHHGGFCKWMFLCRYYSDPVLGFPAVSDYMAKRGTLSPACQEPPWIKLTFGNKASSLTQNFLLNWPTLNNSLADKLNAQRVVSCVAHHSKQTVKICFFPNLNHLLGLSQSFQIRFAWYMLFAHYWWLPAVLRGLLDPVPALMKWWISKICQLGNWDFIMQLPG